MRTHIINYAKTPRDLCSLSDRLVTLRNSVRNMKQKSCSTRQQKNAFDDMGVKKLPKVKELQTEYAKLLEEKKKIYAEYRRSREEMRELLTAKANVDRLLKMDEEQKQEKEKDHDQR